MSQARQTIGRLGEDLAAAFLQAKGFQILARNWRCALGEIDLIVERGGAIHFVEVKTRASTTYGYPEESITAKKRRHLQKAIECWLCSIPYTPARYQADAIAILMISSEKPDIQWIENIL